MKFLFPLSDLCPHCGKKFNFIKEFSSDGKYINLLCQVNQGAGVEWDNINFSALSLNNKFIRIDYRINHLRIINMILEKKTYIHTRDDFGREPPLITNLTWFAPLNQPEIIEEKINTFLLLK